MKLVSYTVQVPKHHATLMRTMGKILTDFEENEGLAFVRIVLEDPEDIEFNYAVDYAVGGYVFGEDSERKKAKRKIREACEAFMVSEKSAMQEVA